MALPEDFSKIFGSTATGGLTPIGDVNYAKGWEFVGSNPPTKNDFSYLQNLSDQKSQWLYSNKLQRTNPFGDIKSDGAAAVKKALENLGFGDRLLEADGYFELPGGFLMQWGHGEAHVFSTTVKFKKPFNVTPFIVLPHKITTDGRYVTSANYTLTSFNLYGWNVNGSAIHIDSYTYFALGM